MTCKLGKLYNFGEAVKPTSCGKLQRISCEIEKNETLKFRKVVKVVISVRPQIKLQSFTLKPFK